MSKSIQVSSFVVPYSQEVLGGVEGLTSSEIAKSTGLSVSEINQKINRPSFRKLCKNNNYDLITTVIKSGERGRPSTNYTLCKRAAKALVAKFDNLIGNRYLDFLFDCEEVVLEIIPKLKAELELLKAKNAKQKKASKKGIIQKPVFVIDMHGDQRVAYYEPIHKDLISRVEQLEYAIRQCAKVGEGTSKKIVKYTEELSEVRKQKDSDILDIVEPKRLH